MPRATAFDLVEYPESDGRPMGETDLHRDWMIRLLDIFRYRYCDQRVYVASDLLLYYQQGDPTRVVVPDVFVVKDCDPGQRRTFKTWEEARTPDFVIEVTSRSSRNKDQRDKPETYARLGVEEYVLYDPTGEYLTPRVQGFRLVGGNYQPIAAGPRGQLECSSLEVILELDGDRLVLRDRRTAEVLLTRAEASEAARDVEVTAREAERAVREAEEAAREAAEARVSELEAEVRRLRDELKRRDEGA